MSYVFPSLLPGQQTTFQPSLLPTLQMIVQPFAEPISLAEMKLHLKQDDITADDALIDSLITVTRDVIETTTGKNTIRNRVMLATTYEYYFDVFPVVDYIRFPRVPLVAVNSVKYVDNNGVQQTLATDQYNVDIPGNKISLAYQKVWPQTQFQRNAITVQFVAGMVDAFTATGNSLAVKGRVLTAGDRVRVMNSGGALPSGLSAKTDYFVVSTSNGGATFSLSLTSGGSAVALADTGSGVNYIGIDVTGFDTLRSAMKLLCGHLNANRENVITGLRAAAVEVPWSVEMLCATQQA